MVSSEATEAELSDAMDTMIEEVREHTFPVLKKNSPPFAELMISL